ncbi:hypothetical protein PI126_g21897 [Phytophthora idaei]|nr:hypothetical protein PI126_g21897 [Phytophthora idaei]
MQKRSGIGKVSPIYRCSEMSFLFDALLQEKTRDLKSQSTEETPVNANGTDVFEEVYTWVLQTNGQLDKCKQCWRRSGRRCLISFHVLVTTDSRCSELCSLFYSMKNDFSAVGIDTEEQRVSFFFRMILVLFKAFALLYIPAFPPQQHDDKSQRVPEISRDVCAARTAFATPAPGQLDAAQVRSACTAPNTKKAYRSYIKGIAAWIHTTFPAA